MLDKKVRKKCCPSFFKDSNVETIEINAQALEAIAKYHIKNSGKLKLEAGHYIILALVSTLSLYLYAETGFEIGKCTLKMDNPTCDKSLTIQAVIGSVVVNFLVSWNTSKQFLESLQKLPTNIQKYFPTKNRIKNVFVALSSIISVAPIALATLVGKKGITLLDWVGFGVTIFSNFFIQCLPFNIVYSDKTVTETIPYGFKWIGTLCCKDAHEFLKLEREKLLLQRSIAGNFVSNLNKLAENLLQKSKQSQGDKRFDLTEVLSVNDTNNFNNKENSYELFVKLLKEHPPEKSNYSSFVLKLYKVGQGVFFWGTGFIANTGLFGYFSDTFESLNIFSSFTVRVLLAATPILALSILIGYFAGRFGRDIVYENAVEIGQHITGQRTYRWQAAISAYPKTMVALTLLSGYLSYYSSSTVRFLLENFLTEHPKSWFTVHLSKFLQGTAYVSALFNFKNALEFWTGVLEYVACNSKDEDMKLCFQVHEAIKNFASSVAKLDPGKVVEHLCDLEHCELLVTDKDTKIEDNNLHFYLDDNREVWYKTKQSDKKEIVDVKLVSSEQDSNSISIDENNPIISEKALENIKNCISNNDFSDLSKKDKQAIFQVAIERKHIEPVITAVTGMTQVEFDKAVKQIEKINEDIEELKYRKINENTSLLGTTTANFNEDYNSNDGGGSLNNSYNDYSVIDPN